MHLLKWDYQPDRRSGSWKSTIITQRKEIKRLLKDNPGLKRVVSEMLAETFSDAVEIASAETGLPDSAFPETCPYTVEQLMGE
jgi:hypothetical protein